MDGNEMDQIFLWNAKWMVILADPNCKSPNKRFLCWLFDACVYTIELLISRRWQLQFGLRSLGARCILYV